jgi:hypothetical protein
VVVTRYHVEAIECMFFPEWHYVCMRTFWKDLMKVDEHIQPLRLFTLSQAQEAASGFQLNEDEKKHLHECEECQDLLEVFARQFSKTRPPKDQPGDAA